ncbi:hypothetical protein SAMN05216330_11947 [Bradyrhizobium sp. Ghvi]|nr:hypothetical protein SAMN05216330_11947 [Bradyrhizobium sp. Ghvi]
MEEMQAQFEKSMVKRSCSASMVLRFYAPHSRKHDHGSAVGRASRLSLGLDLARSPDPQQKASGSARL